MRRKVLLALVLAFTIGTTIAFAGIMAMSNDIDLSFSGNTAYCSLQVRDAGKSIDATLELWRGSTLVTSWHKTGYSSLTISRTYSCISGVSYYLKAYGTCGGQPFETQTWTQICP